MGRNALLAQTLGQLVGQPLGHAPGVHEDESRLVVLHLLGDPLEHFAHLLAGSDCFEFAVRENGLEIQLPTVSLVDDRAERLALAVDAIGSDPYEQLRHEFDRALGRGETDPRRGVVTQRFQAFEREREMRAALISCHRVYFVDDDRPDGSQDLAPACGGEQEIEGLRRRHEDLRRLLEHRRSRGRRHIAASHPHANLGDREPHRPCNTFDLSKRRFEILLNVCR
jgi:hypothetical protein